MITFFKDFLLLCRQYRKQLFISISIFLIVIIATGLIVKHKTTQASFCDSCHFMAPYIRHWKESSHANVECIKCHDYGLINVTVQAVRYFTNTYNSRPKANVRDEKCLSSGCHSKQQLKGKIKFRMGILFDHTTHLEKPLRGEKLRCTSCHNQIVQYDNDTRGHMTVNDKSCFICHFKDAGKGEAITGCNSCHGIPKKEVSHGGFVFNHKPYLKLKVKCKQCHIDIVKGNGSVPKSKCYSCHVERSRNDISREELHRIHVTINGVNCYKCHSDIEHGNFLMNSALEIKCENCHLREHNKPKQLYMGIGGRDTLDMPSMMFNAQVSCTGCHIHITSEGEKLAKQELKEASRNACVTCHGDGYELMFDNWLEGGKKVLKQYKTFLETCQKDYKNIRGKKRARSNIRAALNKMEYNYNFVREGHIPHNIRYSLYLLNVSAKEFEKAMKRINKSYQPPTLGSSLKPKNSCLTFCHGKTLFSEYVSYKGKELPHKMHVTDLELGCENCHSVTEHGKTNINQSVCANCHE